jgi:FkbM family methyltransferase
MAALALSPRQRLSFAAHLFKALVKQHHREMLPLLADLVPADAVVIDAGAHAGQFAKLFARLAPQGRVFAFEPGRYAGAILRRVVRLRGLGNVTLIAAGLSDRAGAMTLSLPIKNSGSLGFGLGHLGQSANGRPAQCEIVELTTLDEFALSAGLTRLDFIKADIEGWEARLLGGGLGVIERFRPAILLEVVAAHLARANDRPETIWRALTPLGYRASRLTAAGPAAAPEFSGDGDYLFQCPGIKISGRGAGGGYDGSPG